MKINIYVLIDPITLKVRYIGRTSTDLNQRLGTHLSKAKNNYTRTHKDNWLRSLLEKGQKPIIRNLCSVDGWQESHQVERFLINRYCDRLLNHDDRGEGSKNHIVTDKAKRLISESLKKQYSENNMPNVARKEVHVYDLDGNYLSTYKSGKTATDSLGIAYSAIHKCTSGIHRQQRGYQFSFIKLEKMKRLIMSKKGIALRKGVKL